MNKTILAVALLAVTTATWGEAREQVQHPEPPPLPPPLQSGDPLTPEITIVEGEQGKIHQYRIGGRIYMVKVVPRVGEPYYLLDTTGDGELDSQAGGIQNISVPKWILFSW